MSLSQELNSITMFLPLYLFCYLNSESQKSQNFHSHHIAKYVVAANHEKMFNPLLAQREKRAPSVRRANHVRHPGLMFLASLKDKVGGVDRNKMTLRVKRLQKKKTKQKKEKKRNSCFKENPLNQLTRTLTVQLMRLSMLSSPSTTVL